LTAIWKPGVGNKPPGFELPTIKLAEYVRAIHGRQIVVLERRDWKGWLEDGDKHGFAPSPAPAFTRTLDTAGPDAAERS
jgi:putative SOS response-associated peptidase YedK